MCLLRHLFPCRESPCDGRAGPHLAHANCIESHPLATPHGHWACLCRCWCWPCLPGLWLRLHRRLCFRPSFLGSSLPWPLLSSCLGGLALPVAGGVPLARCPPPPLPPLPPLLALAVAPLACLAARHWTSLDFWGPGYSPPGPHLHLTLHPHFAALRVARLLSTAP